MVLGNHRGRSPYSSGRGYGRQSYLEDGGKQMGGMGFGKRGTDYYNPEELQDSDYEYGDQEEEEEEEDEDIPNTLRYLQLLEDYARILNQEKGNEEKRGMASLARINSSGSGTKRGMASLARINSNLGPEGKRSLSSVKALTPKRGLSSLRGLNGKRGFHSPLAILGNRGKRGALSSLRSQGFTKYNI